MTLRLANVRHLVSADIAIEGRHWFLAGLDDKDPDTNHKPSKVISLVDPCSAWTATPSVCSSATAHYLIDIDNGDR
jgi:hypothetical protein